MFSEVLGLLTAAAMFFVFELFMAIHINGFKNTMKWFFGSDEKDSKTRIYASKKRTYHLVKTVIIDE